MKHVGTTQATVFLRQFLNSFSTGVAAACIRRTNNSDATNRNQKINIGFQAKCVVRSVSSPRKQKLIEKVNVAFEKHTERETAHGPPQNTIEFNLDANAKIEQQLRLRVTVGDHFDRDFVFVQKFQTAPDR